MIKFAGGLVALGALAATSSWAHHSAAAEYDAAKLLVLTGSVTKVEWANPHVYCHLGVKNASGATTDWYLEMASPNGMRRQGWLPYTLKTGDVVTVEAYAAKDHAALAKVHRIRVADGRWLSVDSAAEATGAAPFGGGSEMEPVAHLRVDLAGIGVVRPSERLAVV
ncbi:MAG TPA: DUF6152 family protein [Bryobacteraceae bacterium]|jgi:hypothetical protein|nr:DUF6152 family protein [Bryobacteraceae bacterium]